MSYNRKCCCKTRKWRAFVVGQVAKRDCLLLLLRRLLLLLVISVVVLVVVVVVVLVRSSSDGALEFVMLRALEFVMAVRALEFV